MKLSECQLRLTLLAWHLGKIYMFNKIKLACLRKPYYNRSVVLHKGDDE